MCAAENRKPAAAHGLRARVAAPHPEPGASGRALRCRTLRTQLRHARAAGGRSGERAIERRGPRICSHRGVQGNLPARRRASPREGRRPHNMSANKPGGAPRCGRVARCTSKWAGGRTCVRVLGIQSGKAVRGERGGRGRGRRFNSSVAPDPGARRRGGAYPGSGASCAE